MGKLKDFTDKVWYGTGAIGLDLSYGMFNGRLSKYLTDVLGLNTNFLLYLTAGARIWDGINDPMMGSIVDNTYTKFGKYRPWVVAGAALNAVVLFFLFFNPGMAKSSAGLYVYIAFMYILWGMTNTAADIPYWSMVPSFTTDPKQRSILATVARTFSGLGQGIVQIGAPLLLNALGSTVTNPDGSVTHIWTARSYSLCAVICSVSLVFFAVLSMSKVRETVITRPQEKFSFKKIFDVIRHNDQLRIFILFAMLSNTGFYTTSGVQDYFFAINIGSTSAQSVFSMFGAVGSILGLAVIPIMMRFTTRRRTYQFSLSLALAGYIGMFFSGALIKNIILMDICYLVTSVGTGSMFVSQTVFLADVVDYGEIKMGKRAESVTFSMKGFLQKMAYTIQTVILFAALGIAGYNDIKPNENGIMQYTARVKRSVGFVSYIIPPLFILLSLIVFSTRFKLHGEYMESITEQVTKAREERAALSENAEAKTN
ncbi:MAG: MFS transporter [Oscillospiraceae bacterium]|nr:MFS transporter [Oscillospiraceae bacterium]